MIRHITPDDSNRAFCGVTVNRVINGRGPKGVTIRTFRRVKAGVIPMPAMTVFCERDTKAAESMVEICPFARGGDMGHVVLNCWCGSRKMVTREEYERVEVEWRATADLIDKLLLAERSLMQRAREDLASGDPDGQCDLCNGTRMVDQPPKGYRGKGPWLEHCPRCMPRINKERDRIETATGR